MANSPLLDFEGLSYYTQKIIALFSSHTGNNEIHVTAEEKAKWNSMASSMPKVLTGTLTAGETTLTITDSSITADSIIELYTNVYGVNPTAVSAVEGSITLTFDSQASDINVRVEVR